MEGNSPCTINIFFSSLWVRQEPFSPQYTLYSCQDNVDCFDLWPLLIITSRERVSPFCWPPQNRGRSSSLYFSPTVWLQYACSVNAHVFLSLPVLFSSERWLKVGSLLSLSAKIPPSWLPELLPHSGSCFGPTKSERPHMPLKIQLNSRHLEINAIVK